MCYYCFCIINIYESLATIYSKVDTCKLWLELISENEYCKRYDNIQSETCTKAQ